MTALDVLEDQLRDAAAARHRRRRRRRGAPLIAVAVLAAALAALFVLDRETGVRPVPDEREAAAPSPSPSPSPPAVPYLSPDPDKIVYVRATSINVGPQGRRDTLVTEDWHRGRESHRLLTWTDEHGAPAAFEHVITANGTMRQIDETGGYRVFRLRDAGDPADTLAREQAGDPDWDLAETITREQAGYLANFRARFEKGTLDPAGDIVFAGRPAVRYHVAPDPTDAPEPPSPDQSFYVDRETGAPLGATSALRLNPDDPPLTSTETVDEIQVLEPTAENLAKLRTLTLKRSS